MMAWYFKQQEHEKVNDFKGVLILERVWIMLMLVYWIDFDSNICGVALCMCSNWPKMRMTLTRMHNGPIPSP